MKIESKWIYFLHGNDIKDAIGILERLDWNLTYQKSGDSWKLFGGDQLIITTKTESELNAFIFGMALGISVLPDEILDQIRKIIRE